MLLRSLIIFLALCVPAVAQQTAEQRIALQIGALVIQSANQASQIDQLQSALTSAQARVKELEDKYEPKEKK